MDQILLVTREESFEKDVALALKGGNANLLHSRSIAEAQEVLRSIRISLLIVDSEIDDGDPIHLVGEAANLPSSLVPFIIFTSPSMCLELKLRAFSQNVDDYLIRPMALEELTARLGSRLKKLRLVSPRSNSFRVGCFLLEPETKKAFVWEDGKTHDLQLTPSEFKIFLLLTRNEGRAFSGREILQSTWEKGVHVTEHSVYAHIYSLRKKLGNISKCIHSLPKGGYQFVSNCIDCEQFVHRGACAAARGEITDEASFARLPA